MGSVNLDNTGSGSAITLSSDGTSLLLNGTAIGGGGGGGADLYAANESSPTAQPSATGANAVAIGDQAIASGSDSFAIGEHSDATGTRTHAFGFAAVATHTNALALGTSRTFAADATAISIANNSTSYGASGSNSIAGGYLNKATATYSLCWGGKSNVAQSGGSSAVVGGWQNNCSGAYSFIGGGRGNKITSGSYSRAGGLQADVNGTGIYTWSSGRFSSDGDAQTSKRVLIASTTDATATVLGTQNINSLAANQVTLPNNSAFAFHGTIVARQQAADGTACAAWKVEGLIRREGSANTTVLVNSATTVLDNTPNWGMALSANTSLGCLKIEVTGAASTDVRWVATIHTSEVTYA